MPMSEQRLSALYQVLMQGLEGDEPFAYRTVEASTDHKTPSIKEQMETLFVQYDKGLEGSACGGPGSFLYGELLRIRPLVAIWFACRVGLPGSYQWRISPVLVDVEHIDEFKAAMILTRSRGIPERPTHDRADARLECSTLTQGPKAMIRFSNALVVDGSGATPILRCTVWRRHHTAILPPRNVVT